MDLNLVRRISSNGRNAWWVTVEEFSDYLGLRTTEFELELVKDLFSVFDKVRNCGSWTSGVLSYACSVNSGSVNCASCK
jgi:hypothetical protein